jgi:hypothetical protein
VCAQSSASAQQVGGLGPDAQLMGGAGFALGGDKLKNPFLGRLRLGGLYAHEPWIVNAGLTVELGALAKFAVGGELELNGWQGLFADAGLVRAPGGAGGWMSHLALGYTVFALEWQQRFDAAKPSVALLLEVRLPMGLWWSMQKRKRAEQAQLHALRTAPVTPPPSAAAPVPLAAAPVLEPPTAADPGTQAELSAALAQAQAQSERGEHARAAMTLGRAYALSPDPLLLLQLSAAEEAQGEWQLAASELKRFLQTAREPAARAQRATVQARLATLERRLPRLRLELTGARGDETILIDGVPAPSAALGYDISLDPGAHALLVTRAGRPLVERAFEAAEAQLVRLELDLASSP